MYNYGVIQLEVVGIFCGGLELFKVVCVIDDEDVYQCLNDDVFWIFFLVIECCVNCEDVLKFLKDQVKEVEDIRLYEYI